MSLPSETDRIAVTVADPAPEPECTDWGPRPPKKKSSQKKSLIGGQNGTYSSMDGVDESLLKNGSGGSAVLLSPDGEPLDGGESGGVDPTQPKNTKKALCVSIATLLISIPALIGAWCWPALVIGIVGGTVTASARSLGHTISFIITGVMVVSITAYLFYCARRRPAPHFNKYGPAYIMVIASLLIMADLLRHVLQDQGAWPEPGSAQYRPGCGDETIKCLSSVGIVFTIFCTYTGFLLLMVATMWNADLLGKISAMREKWRELRGTTQ